MGLRPTRDDDMEDFIMQTFGATAASTTKAGAVERADSRRPLQYTCEIVGPCSEIANPGVGADGCPPADRNGPFAGPIEQSKKTVFGHE